MLIDTKTGEIIEQYQTYLDGVTGSGCSEDGSFMRWRKRIISEHGPVVHVFRSFTGELKWKMRS